MPKTGKKPTSKPKKPQKTKPISNEPKVIETAPKLLRQSVEILYKQKKTTSLLLLIYLLAMLLFSSGLVTISTTSQLRSSITGTNHGVRPSLSSGLSVFDSLVKSTISSSSINSGAQTVLFVIFSLGIIWFLRYLYLKKQPKVRDILYNSQTALIPFFLEITLIFLEIIPALLATYIYSVTLTTGVAANGFEKLIWALICLALLFVSFYLVMSSIFSLYIVTLPNMRPIGALKASWALVKKRRSLIFRKLLFIPLVLIIGIGLISVLFILLIPPLAGWLFLSLTVISVAIAHSYVYALYRELI
jgi:hypothetical protein